MAVVTTLFGDHSTGSFSNSIAAVVGDDGRLERERENDLSMSAVEIGKLTNSALGNGALAYLSEVENCPGRQDRHSS